MNPPEFELQPSEIARGFALVERQWGRTIESGDRTFDYAFGRTGSGRSNDNGLWIRERGQEHRGHWIVASSEPPFAPYQIEITSTKRWPMPKPRIVSAVNNRDGLTLARFIASPLANSAPYALLIPNGTGCWFSYGRVASFDFAPTAAIEASSSAAAAWLVSELRSSNSSVKFANEWISLNAMGKVAALYGAPWLAETQTAMRHVLRVTPGEHEYNRWQEWAIYARAPHSRGWTATDENSERHLEHWGAWLAARFLERRLANGPDHRCIGDNTEDEIAQTGLPAVPSSHQRIESLLWLRDWLQQAATPNEYAQLLVI